MDQPPRLFLRKGARLTELRGDQNISLGEPHVITQHHAALIQ